ncbi:MAG TPA: NlpC/P60 family protein [Pseudoneobacillus sp.]|nr:NlpC/P60 family protein [Pseudoneobacillus sp.]
MKKILSIAIISILLWGFHSSSPLAQYYVKPGDTMWKISKKTGLSYDKLINWNPQISNPGYIMVGQRINTTSGKLTHRIEEYARSLQDITTYTFGAPSSQAPYKADCSSWVQHVYAKFGIDLPRTSREQAKVGTPLTFQQLKKGDLVFFGSNANGTITHVGIYLGHGYWISNLNSRKDVTILSVWGNWSYQHFLYGARVI